MRALTAMATVKPVVEKDDLAARMPASHAGTPVEQGERPR